MLALLVLLCCWSSAAAQALSPPWWVAYGMFDAALRQDACLNVSRLQEAADKQQMAYVFNITACGNASDDKLLGLATFLTVRYDFGGTLFVSRILDSAGQRVQPAVVRTGDDALQLAAAALGGNAYFERTATSQPLPCMHLYWAVFRPAAVQLWVDNLADYWGNLNLLAADLMERVFRLQEFGVRATTLKFSALQRHQGSGSDGGAPARGASRRLAAASSQPLAAEAEGRRAQGASGAARLLAGLDLDGWQPLQAAPWSTRRQLGAADSQALSSWRVSAQCAALHVARWVGGERGAQRLQQYMLQF